MPSKALTQKRPVNEPPALPEYAAEFLRDACTTRRTEIAYRTALTRLQRFAEEIGLAKENTPLPGQAIHKALLADYYSWLKQHKYRAATIQLYLSGAYQYLMWLEADRKLDADLHVAEIKTQLDRKTDKGRRIRPEKRSSDLNLALLLEHYAKLPDKPTEQKRLTYVRNHAILITLYATAGRAAEIASLNRADVAEGFATQVNIVGKGKKERTLILTEEAQSAIRAYLATRKDTYPGLFISHGAHAGSRLTTSTLWRVVDEASKAVFGMGKNGKPLKRFGPHAFRHLRAQTLANEGMSIPTLQAMLGHASIETTRGTYAPKTPVETIVDELSHFGLSAKDAIREAKKKRKKDTKQPEGEAADSGDQPVVAVENSQNSIRIAK